MQSLIPQQSHDMIKMENYGYSMGSPFHQELMNSNQGGGNNGLNGNNVMGGHEQGLSPPYSNQSPPHSVQSNMALSPHAYMGKCSHKANIYI